MRLLCTCQLGRHLGSATHCCLELARIFLGHLQVWDFLASWGWPFPANDVWLYVTHYSTISTHCTLKSAHGHSHNVSVVYMHCRMYTRQLEACMCTNGTALNKVMSDRIQNTWESIRDRRNKWYCRLTLKLKLYNHLRKTAYFLCKGNLNGRQPSL